MPFAIELAAAASVAIFAGIVAGFLTYIGISVTDPASRSTDPMTTKAPWTIETRLNVRAIVDANGQELAFVDVAPAFHDGKPCGSITSQGRTPPELEAIAELIAAAPSLRDAGDDLAELLEAALETHIYEPGEVPDDAPELRALKAWRLARAGAAHLADVGDEQLAPYDMHARRLKAEGFSLGRDAHGFDVYRGADCSGARAWIEYQGEDERGQSRFTVKRGALVGSSADA